MTPLRRGHTAWQQRGKAWHTPLFFVRSSPIPCAETKDHAFGLVVKKKIGSAVQRNRIKRRLRHAFVQIKKKCALSNSPRAHVLVVKSPDILKESFDTLSEALASYLCCEKRGVLKPSSLLTQKKL